MDTSIALALSTGVLVRTQISVVSCGNCHVELCSVLHKPKERDTREGDSLYCTDCGAEHLVVADGLRLTGEYLL